MPSLVGVVLRGGLEPGTVVTISPRGRIRRHRVARDPRCPVCGDPGTTRPGGPALRPRPAASGDPTRSNRGPAPLADSLRQWAGGRRFGLLDRHVRISRAAFPVAEIGLRSSAPVGMGRGATVRDADDTAVLEAFERLGGNPGRGTLIRGITAAELGSAAVPLGTLGRCSPRQLSSALCRVRPFDEHTPMDWVRAFSVTDGPDVLVPADIAYPWYRYPRDAVDPLRSRYFLDSSSGTALGANREEALLHALFELVERDQFQLAWHGRTPLLRLDPAAITDAPSRLLMHVVDRCGFDLSLLVATSDLALPVVWALAVNRERAVPASFSTAGAHPDPARAVRSALWELAQQASSGTDPEIALVRERIANPWGVSDLADHWRRYTDPALLPRVTECVGTEMATPAEAFPGWPDRYLERAGRDLLEGVRLVSELLAAAGLTTVLAVDQSADVHAAAGVSVVRAVVPGLVGLSFGQAHQRYTGLGRLLGGIGVVDPADHPGVNCPVDPHPFP